MTALIRRLPNVVSGPNADKLDRWIPELPFSVLRRYSALSVIDKVDQIVGTVPGLVSGTAALTPRSGSTGAYCRVESGLPHLELNNGRTTDRMETAADFSVADGGAITAYGVVRFADAPAASVRRVLLGIAPEGGNQGVQINGTSRVLSLYRGASPWDSSVAVPIGAWAVFVAVFNGAASVARVGTSEATGTAGTGAIASAKLSIGATAGASSTPHRVDIRELGIISGALDATQRQSLVDTLKQIYSIS